MPEETTAPSHVVIRRRHGNECRFCRQPMEPGTPAASKPCEARARREANDHSRSGIETLRTIGHRMQASIAAERHTKRKRTAKKGK